MNIAAAVGALTCQFLRCCDAGSAWADLHQSHCSTLTRCLQKRLMHVTACKALMGGQLQLFKQLRLLPGDQALKQTCLYASKRVAVGPGRAGFCQWCRAPMCLTGNEVQGGRGVRLWKRGVLKERTRNRGLSGTPLSQGTSQGFCLNYQVLPPGRLACLGESILRNAFSTTLSSVTSSMAPRPKPQPGAPACMFPCNRTRPSRHRYGYQCEMHTWRVLIGATCV